MNIIKRFLNIVWELVETTTFAFGFVMVTYLFLFQTGEVRGNSSYPTWQNQERFITEKISYRFEKPQRGDFIVLQSPKNPDVDFIKRIVGLPNEIIKISHGMVFINGQQLDESNYLKPNTYTGAENYLKENQNLLIPYNYYFVMGDNRTGSSDSRDFGPISEKSIVGKVVFRFWPLEKLGQNF